MRAKPGTHNGSYYSNHGCRCPICTEAWRDVMRTYRQRRQAKGLCVECLTPAAPFARCPAHRAKASQSQQEARHVAQ